MTVEEKLDLIKSEYPGHSNEFRIHDIKLLGHNEVVKLNEQRLKAYAARISKHISYLENYVTEAKNILHFATPKMDLEHFTDYRKMLGFLRNNA